MWYRNNKNFISAFIFVLVLLGSSSAFAQNNTSSPYSYYGLGEISQPVNGKAAALGGTNLAYRGGSNLNINNPASLTSLDSMKFVFNVGLTSKTSIMNQKGKSDTFHDNNFSELSFGFRISPSVATAIALVPYTNVGYDIATKEQVAGGTNEFYQRSLSGTGGLNKFVWSTGVSLFKNLSLGVNGIFLFGNNTSNENLTLERSSYVYSSQQQLISRGVYASFGLQYGHQLLKDWELTVGANFQPKQGISSKRKLYVTNYQSNLGDTVYKNTLDRGTFDVPLSYGFGVGMTKNKQLWLGADYSHEQWSDTKIFTNSNNFVDRNRYSFGMNYIANDGYATKFLKKLTYRLGAFYDTGYISVQNDRIKTRGLSFGLGIPMAKQKGMINIAFEFGQMGTTSNDNIREDYGKFTLELSLFERWFVKRKYQ
ncbi:hypothetical protein [Ancylomarina longa]|uniref:Aromatic hydrocarbon degradation protein n=1 Tax=Ancylomarina longa TaxID=2487017 RepID=A0A434AVY5_9BACT|nr:hypothetical protein [Ancylomarina longa]RUT78656.1 hypothetical protein DLK05_07415 [Ancylomarina longa]